MEEINESNIGEINSQIESYNGRTILGKPIDYSQAFREYLSIKYSPAFADWLLTDSPTEGSENLPHTLNALIAKENLRDFNDWKFIEPQTDKPIYPKSSTMLGEQK